MVIKVRRLENISKKNHSENTSLLTFPIHGIAEVKGGKFASPDGERSGFVLGTGTNRSTEARHNSSSG